MTVKANWKACKKPRASAEKRFRRPQPLDAPTGCIFEVGCVPPLSGATLPNDWMQIETNASFIAGQKCIYIYAHFPSISGSATLLRRMQLAARKKSQSPRKSPPPSPPFFYFNILIIDILAGGVSRGYLHFSRFNAISRTWSESCATCSFSIPLPSTPLHLLCVWFHTTTTNSPLPVSPLLIAKPCKWFFKWKLIDNTSYPRTWHLGALQ